MNDDIDGDEAMKNLEELTRKIFRKNDGDTEDVNEEEPEADE